MKKRNTTVPPPGIDAAGFAEVAAYWLKLMGRQMLTRAELEVLRDWWKGFPAGVLPEVRVEVIKCGIRRAQETLHARSKALYGLRACQPHIDAEWEALKAACPGVLHGRPIT